MLKCSAYLNVISSSLVLSMILILLYYVVSIGSTGFHITWLRDSTCSIRNSTTGNSTQWNDSILINGLGTTQCAIQISPSPSDQSYMLQIAYSPIQAIDYIYYVQHDSIKTKYILVDIQSMPQCDILLQSTIDLYFRGSFDIKIMTQSPHQRQNDTTTHCPLLEYNYVINSCIDEGYGVDCDLQCHPHCSCFLGDKQVVSQCGLQKNKGFITYLSNIYSLNFNNQSLTNLQPCSFCSIGYMMYYLDLNSNRLRVIKPGALNGLQNLQWLDLSNNQLTSVNDYAFNETVNLHTMYLNFNPLMAVQPGLFLPLINLNWLELKYVQVSSIAIGTFGGLKSLTHLDMSSNNITNPPAQSFQELQSLMKLLLGHNQLSTLNAGFVVGLNQLEVLDLIDNRLTELESGLFQSMKHTLKALNLAKNDLQTLPVDLFTDLTKLDVLDLRDNRLKALPMLGNLPRLTLARLQHNELSDVDDKSFVNLSIRARLVVDDPVICHCMLPNDSYECIAQNPASNYLTCDRLLAQKSLRVLAFFLAFGALLGNLFVICWRRTKKYENKVQSVLLTNLAMSDLLMGLYLLILASADVYFGDRFLFQSEIWRTGAMCKTAGAFAILSSEASVFFIMLISIDRFIGVLYPYSTRKLGKISTLVTVSMMWIMALVITITASCMANKNDKFYETTNVCIGLPLAPIKPNITKVSTPSEQEFHRLDINLAYTDQDLANIYFYDPLEDYYDTTQGPQISGLYFANAIFLGLNLLCFLIVFVCYLGIMWSVYKTGRRSSRYHDRDEDSRLTVKVVAIVTTDCLCWIPIIIVGILVQSKVTAISSTIFAWMVTLVLPINSVINPFLYTVISVLFDRTKRKASEIRCPSCQLLLRVR